MRRLTAALVAMVLLAGCGDKKAPAASPTPTTSAKATTATPSESPAATIAQWGSRIAEVESPVLEALGKFDDENCSVVYDKREFNCTLVRHTAGLTAETMRLNLLIAQDHTKDDYVGDVPTELKSLMTRTMAALSAFYEVDDKMFSCSVDCQALLLKWDKGRDDVVGVLNAWKPYI